MNMRVISTTPEIPKARAIRNLLVTPASCILATICFTAAFFISISPGAPEGATVDKTYTLYCSGGGPVKFFSSQSNRVRILWDRQLFLSIALGFGRLTYAEAKTLDFAWDLLVGTGGQAAIVALVYPLLRRVVTAHMEEHPRTQMARTLSKAISPCLITDLK
jgi:hypothetical protein